MRLSLRRTVAFLLPLLLTCAVVPAQTGTVRVTEGPKNNPAQFVGRSTINYPMIQVGIENRDTVNEMRVRRLTFTASGTGNEVTAMAAAGVRCYHDANNDGEASIGGAMPETQLGGTLLYAADNGTVTFDFTAAPVAIPANQTAYFVCLYNFNGSPTVGQTFKLDLLATGDIDVVFGGANMQATKNGLPALGIQKAVGQGKVLLNVLPDLDNQVPAFLPNWTYNSAIRLKIDNTFDERVSLASFTVDVVGTADDAAVIQPNGVGFQIVAGDTTLPDPMVGRLGMGSISGDNGSATVVLNPPLEIPRGAVLFTYVLVDCAYVKPQYFRDMKFSMPVGSVVANGLDSGVSNLQVLGENLAGPLRQYRGSLLETTVTSRDLGTTFCTSGAVDYPVLAFTLKTHLFETVTVTSLTFRSTGSLNEITELSNVQLYLDTGTREGRVDIEGQPGVMVADTPLGTPQNFLVDDGTVTIPGLSIGPITTGQTRLLLACDVSSVAEEGRTFQFSIPTALSVTGSGSKTTADPVISLGSSGVRTIQTNAVNLIEETGAREARERKELPRRGTDMLAWNFDVVVSPNEPLNAERVDVQVTGTLNDPDALVSAKLGLDNNFDGDFTDANEFLIAEIPNIGALGNNPLLSFVASDIIEFKVDALTRVELYLTMNGAASDTVYGRSVQFTIPPNGLHLRGAFSSTLAQAPTLPFASGSKVIRRPYATLELSTQVSTGLELFTCVNNSFGEFTVFRFVPGLSENVQLNSVRVLGTSSGGTGFLNQITSSVGVWGSNNNSLNISASDFIVDSIEDRPFISGVATVDDLIFGNLVEYFDTTPPFFGCYVDFTSPVPVATDGSVWVSAQVDVGGMTGTGFDSGDPMEFFGDYPPASILRQTMAAGMSTPNLVSLGSTPVAPGTNDAFAMRWNTGVTLLEPLNLNTLRLKIVKSRPELNLAQVLAPNAITIGYTTTQIDPETFTATIDYGAETATFGAIPGFWYTSPTHQMTIFADILPTAPEGDWIEFHIEQYNHWRFEGTCSLAPSAAVTHNFNFSLPAVGKRLLFMTEGLDIDLRLGDDDLPWVALPDKAVSHPVGRLRVRTISNIEQVTLRGLTVHVAGTAHDVTALAPGTGLELYDSTTPLASAVFNADNGLATFTGINLTIGTSTRSLDIRMTPSMDTQNGLNDGQNFLMSFDSVDVDAVGALSGIPVRNYTLEHNNVTGDDAFPFLLPEVRIGAGRIFTRQQSSTPATSFAIADGVNVPTLPFTLKPDRSENVRLEEITVATTGTMNDFSAVDAAAVRFYEDKSPLRTINLTGNGPDVLLGIGTLTMDDGTARIRFTPPLSINANATMNCILGVDLNGTALDFETFQHFLAGPVAVQSRGLLSSDLLTPHYGTDNAFDPSAPSIAGPLISIGKATIDMTVTNRLPQPDPVNPRFVLPDQDLVPVLHLDLKVLNIEPMQVTGFTFETAGTGNEATGFDTNGVKLWDDVDADGVLDATDVLLGMGSFALDNQSLPIDFIQPINLVENQTIKWLLTYDFAATAQLATTYQARLNLPPGSLVPDNDIVNGSGLFTLGSIGVVRTATANTEVSGPILQVSSGIIEVRRGNQNPASRDILPSGIDVPVLQLSFEDLFDMEAVKLNRLDLNVATTMIPVANVFETGGVKLWRETTVNGVVDAGDVFVGTAVLNETASRLTFDLTPIQELVALGEKNTYVVTATFDAPPGTNGPTVKFDIGSVAQFAGIGQTASLATTFRLPSVIQTNTFTFRGSSTTFTRLSATPDAGDGITPDGPDQVLLNFTIRPSSAAAVRMDSLRIAANGTMNEVTGFTPGSVRFVRDLGTANVFDAADQVLASGSFVQNNGTLTFDLGPAGHVLERNTTQPFLIVASLSGTATEGQTMGILISDATTASLTATPEEVASAMLGTFPIGSGPSPIVPIRVTVTPPPGLPAGFDVLPTSQRVSLWKGVLTPSLAEDVDVKALTIQAGGTANDASAFADGMLTLVDDRNNNGLFDTGDVTLKTASIPADNGQVLFENFTLNIDKDEVVRVLVYGDLNGSAAFGDTFRYTATAMQAQGETSARAALIAGLPLAGQLVTVAPASFLFQFVGAESIQSVAYADEANLVLQTLRLLPSTADDINLQSLAFTLNVPASVGFINGGSVRLVRDVNASGRLDAGDVTLAAGGSFDGSGRVAFSGLGATLPKGVEAFLLLVVDLNAGGAPNAIGAAVLGGDAAGTSATGGGAAIVVGLPVTGALRHLVSPGSRLTAPRLEDFEQAISIYRPDLTWQVITDPTRALSGASFMTARNMPPLSTNADFAMYQVPAFDATSTPGIKIGSFWARYKFPNTNYRGRFEYSVDNGANWSTGNSITGSSSTWTYVTRSFTGTQNTSNNLLLRFSLDGGTGDPGDGFLEVDRVIYQLTPNCEFLTFGPKPGFGGILVPGQQDYRVVLTLRNTRSASVTVNTLAFRFQDLNGGNVAPFITVTPVVTPPGGTIPPNTTANFEYRWDVAMPFPSENILADVYAELTDQSTSGAVYVDSYTRGTFPIQVITPIQGTMVR